MKQADATTGPTAPGVPQGHHHQHHAHRRHGGFAGHLQQAAAQKAAGQAVATPDDLRTAMTREAVPATWERSLTFIMEHESGGRVGVGNHVDTARGLFQLTQASYHLNPHGAASFGNAVEEAQGGIRYIEQRYQTADNAAAFWQAHRWY